MMDSLTPEQVRLLADAERKMDAGELPYVVIAGNRMLVDPLVMEEFGLETGQTVSNGIMRAILEAHVALCRARIDIDKAQEAPPQDHD